MQDLFDAIPGNNALLDAEGRIVLVNQAWRCFAADNQLPDPLYYIGTSYLEVCDRAARTDVTAAAVAAGLRAILQGGPEFQLTYPCHAPTEQRWFSLKARPIEVNGRPAVLVIHDNVTDLKRAELAQEASNAQLQLALAAGRMGTWDADLRSGIERWSAGTYHIFGVDPASFTPSYTAFMALMEPHDRERFHSSMDAVFQGSGGPEFSNECRIVLPDGKVRWIGGSGLLLRDSSGRPERLLGICHDITDRKERELELEAAYSRLAEQTGLVEQRNRELELASRAKDQFVANISHEIRTPLNAVLGFADLLKSSSLEPTQARYVDVIHATGRHLLAIINDVLDLAKFEAGRLALERIDFVLDDILEQVRSLLAPQAAERGLALRVEPTLKEPVVVCGDPTRLQQILLNLVGNGLKFTAQGSVTLTVHLLPTATSGGVRLRFEVQDTGIGIPTERQAELFQPFVQADSSISRQYGGTGLGLAICRRLVLAMGGEIGLESESGRGSLFWIELPFESGDALMAAKRNVQPPPPIRPLRVLVVDDVAANRELLAAMLGECGHEILLAADGAAAVDIVAREGPDLVLLDIQMPVMDGVTATRRIRLLGGQVATVPIFALTASVMPDERQRYLTAGMNRCLTKPVVWPDLFAALAEVAAGQLVVSAGTPVRQAAPSTDATEPLLDLAMLAGMARTLPPAVFRQLLARGLEGAARSQQQLWAALGDPLLLAQEAHRLRGTAGSFGLARISALARAIESQPDESGDVALLVAELEAALTATRAAAEQLEFDV
ncbi:MAG: ATP-binding protein [Geminicoccaceae bacterium]